MKTALIAMCKAPEPGRTKTRLCPPLSPAQASDLYSALLADTFDLLNSFPDVLSVAAITPPDGEPYFKDLGRARIQLWPVEGTDIGVCLHRVLSRALGAGHTHAIAINSDGPSLPPEHIRDTVTALDRGADVVFGPNDDGGYYLIGIRRPLPRLLLNGDVEFEDIAWSTANVLEQTLSRAHALGLDVMLLPGNYDIDRIEDLRRLADELNTIPLDRCRHTRAWLDANPISERSFQPQPNESTKTHEVHEG